MIQRLKFGRDLAQGRCLAHLLAVEAEQIVISRHPDLLIPMPLHWRRRWIRSFNQAGELASQLSQQLNIPCDASLVRRRLATPSQASLSATQRRNNLREAFAVVGTTDKPLLGKRVAIIDDVMTTGSSIYAVAQLLKDAGAADVQAWVAARAGKA